jgi:LPS-assembly lipoprotein
MSSSSPMIRALALVAALGAAPLLAACTGFTPIYGDTGLGNQRIAVKYGPPGSRLDQIIYQDLALKLGKSDSPDAAQIYVSTSAVPRQLTSQTVVNPRLPYQAVVSAVITVVDAKGGVLFQGSRSTTADFTYGAPGVAQALSSNQAFIDASERGAKALADTVRLAVLQALAKRK